MVGRGAEWSAVTAALDGMREGRGGCLFMVGEPGIGKSRLVAEAVAEAERRDMWVLAGRASPLGRAVPYESYKAALLHGLRSRALPEPRDQDFVQAGLAALLPGFVEGPAVEVSPVLLGETVLRLARSLGGRNGTLIVLDDLQWACGDTLAITEYLADNAALERVVVVGTSRPEGPALELVDALERRRSAEVLTVGRLDLEAVKEMAASCLPDDHGAPPPALVELLNERSAGLPFLVDELLAALLDRGALVSEADGWTLDPSVRVGIPLSFAQTVRERLAELSTEERRVLDTAAILGRDFDWSDLPRLATIDEARVLDAMSTAVDATLLEEAGDGRFRFRHALTVDAILEQMLGSQRRRLAARTLNALAAGSGPASGKLELAAHVAVQAGRCAEAARYLTEEARRALAAGALATAIATARRARSLLTADEPESLAADEVLLSALSQAGDAVAAEEVGRALVDQLDLQGASVERRARARLLLAKSAAASLDPRRARALCDEGLALEPRDEWLRLALLLMLAEVALAEDPSEAAVTDAQAALEAAETAGFDELACDALLLLGRHSEAMELAQRAGLPLHQLRIVHRTAWQDLGRSVVSSRLAEARATAQRVGALALGAELEHGAAISHMVEGDLDAAARSANRAVESAGRYRLGELAAVGSGLQAALEAVRGHRTEAERLVADALAVGGVAPRISAAISGTALVLAALADDDLPAATERAAETKGLLGAGEMRFEPQLLGMFYGLAAVTEAAGGSSEPIEQRDSITTGAAFPHASFCIARAILAGRAGDVEAAESLFAAGDDGLTRAPWFRAVYRRYAAEAALADGWGTPALWLAEAERYFEQVASKPLARACRSLLRLTGTSSRRPHAEHGIARDACPELTTRETDVLALVADGLTNKRIAARLYLSPRTVEKHVERILTKTGRVNRTALAAAAGQLRPATESLRT